MNDDELFDILDEIDNEDKIQCDKVRDTCNCNIEKTNINGYLTCTKCGMIGDYVYTFDKYSNNYTLRNKSQYKRHSHYKYKLREIQGLHIPIAKQQNTINKIFKDINVTDIYQIKNILRKNKKSKLNKYIYWIYKQKTGNDLFKFTHKQMCIFINDFKVLENKFKEYTPKNRINIFGYQYIMYKLLPLRGVDCTNKIFYNKIKHIRDKNNELWDKITSNNIYHNNI